MRSAPPFQINGALAVIKRVKELAPDIATILGGTNVSGEAGAAVLRHYPSVDYVFFGEGDEVFALVCRIAMGAEPGPMPYGVVRHGEEIPDPIPHRMTQDMNKICYTDYSDFIAEWDREQAGAYGPPMFGEKFVEENKQLLTAAAREACMDEDILTHPGGFDYVVRSGGKNFSGGQRQRITIARALAVILLGIFYPVASKWMMTLVIPSGNTSLIYSLMVFLLGCAVSKYLFSIVQTGLADESRYP